jgi:predicted DNA-binding protein YlxM (UPF0122 family)
MPNSHKFWTPKEEQRLKDLLNSDTPLQEIAQLLGRSTDAIVQKVKRLDLKIPDSWRTERKTTKSAFQTLSWIRALLSDVKNMKDLEKVRRQVDKALDALSKSAAEGFEKSLQESE